MSTEQHEEQPLKATNPSEGVPGTTDDSFDRALAKASSRSGRAAKRGRQIAMLIAGPATAGIIGGFAREIGEHLADEILRH